VNLVLLLIFLHFPPVLLRLLGTIRVLVLVGANIGGVGVDSDVAFAVAIL
jgi:hypothetical protein